MVRNSRNCNFVSADKPMLAGADNMSGGQVNLYYHLDDCQNAIDLLRNESPMYLLYSGSGGENGIKTTQEVVGEGEV